MLLDQVTDTQMQAARFVGGAAMVALLAAPIFRGRAQTFRLTITVLYCTVLIGAIIYFVL